MKTQPLSIRLEPDLNAQVTAIAEALDRPKSWIVEQALKDYVAIQQWQLAAIDEGIAAADAGDLVNHEDVVAWVRSLGKPDELPVPKSK
jgi:predicted transcriptional regulator